MRKRPLFFIVFLSVASLVFGAQTVSAVVQGIVPEMLTIASDMTVSTTIDIFNTTNTMLGYINIFSNRVGTWKITITSSNGGAMASTSSGNGDRYPYKLNFGTIEDISLEKPFVFDATGKTGSGGSVFALLGLITRIFGISPTHRFAGHVQGYNHHHNFLELRSQKLRSARFISMHRDCFVAKNRRGLLLFSPVLALWNFLSYRVLTCGWPTMKAPRGGMMKVIRFVLALLLAAGVAASASAFSFVPMSASLSPSGAQSVMSFKVTNDTPQAIAVVIKVMTRSIDIEGKESNQPVGSEFIVFPTRVVVQPNSFQTIKVQYKGAAFPAPGTLLPSHGRASPHRFLETGNLWRQGSLPLHRGPLCHPPESGSQTERFRCDRGPKRTGRRALW